MRRVPLLVLLLVVTIVVWILTGLIGVFPSLGLILKFIHCHNELGSINSHIRLRGHADQRRGRLLNECYLLAGVAQGLAIFSLLFNEVVSWVVRAAHWWLTAFPEMVWVHWGRQLLTAYFEMLAGPVQSVSCLLHRLFAFDYSSNVKVVSAGDGVRYHEIVLSNTSWGVFDVYMRVELRPSFILCIYPETLRNIWELSFWPQRFMAQPSFKVKLVSVIGRIQPVF